jgi:hypothetical protein
MRWVAVRAKGGARTFSKRAATVVVAPRLSYGVVFRLPPLRIVQPMRLSISPSAHWLVLGRLFDRSGRELPLP